MSLTVDIEQAHETGMSLDLILRACLSVDDTEADKSPEYIFTWQDHEFPFRCPIAASAILPSEELNRRKSLVEHIFAMREELPGLDITTAELVRLARGERKWFYES